MKFKGSGYSYQVVCACGNRKFEVRNLYGGIYYRCTACGIERAESTLTFETG